MLKSRMLLAAASVALLPALMAVAPQPAAAAGSSRVPLAIADGDNPNITHVADRCGRHHHWMSGHRDRFGHWVRGRCVENRYDRPDRYDRYNRY